MRSSSLTANSTRRAYALRAASALAFACCSLCVSAAAYGSQITGQVSIFSYVNPVGSFGFGTATALTACRAPQAQQALAWLVA